MKTATFDTKLATWKVTNANSQAQLKELCDAAMVHFSEHGDTSYLSKIYNAMSKNYNRRPAFNTWVIVHAPLKMVKHDTAGLQYVKDDKSSVTLDVEGAIAQPYWEYVPDKGDDMASIDDFYKALLATVKRFEAKLPDGDKLQAATLKGVIEERQAHAHDGSNLQ